jgi:UDP-N-acetylglucosamine 2-epimerase (non-hydrolysing)
MLDQVLALFQLESHIDLDVMTTKQTLSSLTARLCTALGELFSREHYDLILVQGDTTSTFIGALTAFYHQIPVGHVEAGLRTENRYDPFPEEINRRLTTRLSTLHFAPTEYARHLLIKEGVEPDRVYITGNTVIDALRWVINHKQEEMKLIRQKYQIHDKQYLLITLHRRENIGDKMAGICKTLIKIAEENPYLTLFFPVHLNPRVREVVFPILGGHPRILLCDPVGYVDFIALMEGCYFIMSDSGGIQEEAPTLGKPVLVLRDTTERPEAVQAGTALLTGTDPERIYKNAMVLLNDEERYREMARLSNPFGNGDASKKICEIIEKQEFMKNTFQA